MLLACPHAFVRMAMSNASDEKLVISLLQEAGTNIPSELFMKSAREWTRQRMNACMCHMTPCAASPAR